MMSRTWIYVLLIFFHYTTGVLLQTGRHGGLAWIKLHGPAGPAEEGRVSSLHHRQGHFGRGQDIGSGGGIIPFTIQ